MAGDCEFLEVECDLQPCHEVALWDTPESVGVRLAIGMADDHRHQAPPGCGRAQGIDDRKADAGRVNDHSASGRCGELLGQAVDALNDDRVGRVQGEALQVTYGDRCAVIRREGERAAVIRCSDGTFQDHDCRAIPALPKIDAHEELAAENVRVGRIIDGRILAVTGYGAADLRFVEKRVVCGVELAHIFLREVARSQSPAFLFEEACSNAWAIGGGDAEPGPVFPPLAHSL